jgi:ketosteroid isomerase-like protein
MKKQMNKTRILILLFWVFVSWDSTSQSIHREINNQVWRVQLEAMNSNQADKFISVMSDDVIQVSYSRQTIRNKEQFHNQANLTYKRITEKKLSRSMEFRFLNRIANDRNAFEDGFYKYELISEKLEKQVYYGYFQVVLRKEAEFWKVLVDYDSDDYNGLPVTKELFENAKTLDSYEN